MKRKASLIAFLLLCNILFIFSQSRKKPTLNVPVFINTPILFNPTYYPNGVVQKDGLTYLENGRIALKKVRIPSFKNYTAVNVEVKLVSNGDPWDKSGSCFIIPNTSKISMLDIAADKAKYPAVDFEMYEKLVGIVSGKDYKPTVELMRFMTPFGVGHFSDLTDSLSMKRKPAYVDGWAPNVVWNQDVTDLLPLMDNEFYVGVFIDTWTNKGYKVDVTLSFTESAVRGDKRPKTHVEPLLNTVYYLGQQLPDIFSRKALNVPFTIPKKAKNARIKYIATGHGGHDGGDEFRPQKHILSIDNKTLTSFTPWRTDCASFRRFNPSTGVWLIKRDVAYITDEGKRAVKQIEEPLGSSDLSRSNWCPGSDVMPYVMDVSSFAAGNHTFTILIPESTPMSENKLNHWLVSAYLVWEE